MTGNDQNKLGEQLSAYLDGELSDSEHAAVEVLLRDDPSARAELKRLRRATEWVAELPRRTAPSSLVGEVMAGIERNRLLENGPPPPGRRTSRWRSFNALLLTAAMITVAVTLGLWAVYQSETGRMDDALALRTGRGGSEKHLFEDVRAPAPSTTDEMDAASGRARRVEANEEAAGLETTASFGATAGPVEHEEPDRSRVDQVASPPAVLARADIRLDVACPDRLDLKRCANRLDGFLRRQQDRSPTRQAEADDTTISLGDTASVAGGQTGVIERTIHLPVSRLRTLVQLFEAPESIRREISLSVGEIVKARGADQSRELAVMLTQHDDYDARSTAAERKYGYKQELTRAARIRGRAHADRTESAALAKANRAAEAPTFEIVEAKKHTTSEPTGVVGTDILEELLKQMGLRPPAREESTGAPGAAGEALRKPVAPSGRGAEPLIRVTVRLRGPVPPPGPPGQLVPRSGG